MFILAAVLLATFSQHDARESLLLNSSPEAFREEGTLMIVTTEGDTLTFTDRLDQPHGLETALFRLVDHLPELNLWTVKILGYEWIGWQMISGETGETTSTIGPGFPSPHGTRLLCMNEDIMAGYSPNGIQIWSIEPDGTLDLDFEQTSMPWGPRNGRWVNDTTISFTMLSYNYEACSYSSKKGKLTLINGLWTPSDREEWNWQ